MQKYVFIIKKPSSIILLKDFLVLKFKYEIKIYEFPKYNMKDADMITYLKSKFTNLKNEHKVFLEFSFQCR